MVRKLLFPPVVAIFGLVFLASCTRPNGVSSRISISFPQASLSSADLPQSVSTYTATTKWGLSSPTVSSQFNCYAVAVGAGSTTSGNSCTSINGTKVAQAQTIFGVFPAGSTQQLEVASGPNRTIYLFGFKANNIADCISISGTPINSLNPTNFSPPHLLDQVTMNLSPGDVTVNLEVPSSVGATTVFEDCSPFSFGSGTSTALTVTAISPAQGSIAGGTSVTITGTGFDGSTTVEIGAAQCTVSSYTSTNISCTTAPESAGLYGVTVMRSVTSASLPSAFTYASPASLSFTYGSTFDFGSVNVGANAVTALTITNSGGLSATGLSAATLANDFSFNGGSYPGATGDCGTTLSAGASCDVVVRIDPTGAGYRTDDLTISYNEGSPITITLEGTGVIAPTAVLTISDGPTYDFGSLTSGFSQNHYFTITNVGSASATSMSDTGLAAPFSFVGGSYPGTGGTCGSSLSMGSSCTIAVNFSPTAIGIFNDIIDISYDDGVTMQSATRDVQGTGTAVPTFDILGLTGGADSTQDDLLENHHYPTVHWENITGESSYDVTIYESDATTIKCSTVNVAVDVVNYSFSACPLDYGSMYYLHVVANTGGGPIAAANGPMLVSVDYIPVVTAAYPSTGANWNDYVIRDGTEIYNATDTACTIGSAACIHGGEIRKVEVTAESSCAGLSASDSAGAFNWVCVPTSGYVTFFSTGFLPYKGLSDLIIGSTFIDMSVSISGGAASYYSNMEVWWTNPIVLLSSNATVTTLNSSGTIYTYDVDINTAGLVIGAEKISILGQYGATMYNDGSNISSCDAATGNPGSPNSRCMVSSYNNNYLWFEGAYNGYDASFPSQYGIIIGNGKFSRFHNLLIREFTADGVKLSSTNKSRLTSVTSSENGTYGIQLYASTYNRLEDVFTHSNGNSGVGLNQGASNNFLNSIFAHNNGDGLVINSNSLQNKVQGLYAFNNSSYGLDILGASYDNVVVDLAVSGGSYGGVSITDANGLKLSNVTVVNAGPTNYGGLRTFSGSNYVYRNILSLNNDWGLEFGISSGVVSTTTVANVAIGGPTTYAITDVGSSIDFKGVIKTDGTCFSNSVGLDNSCVPSAGSQVVSVFGASTIVGKVTADDGANSTDTFGQGSYSTDVLDWNYFENVFRGWGLDGSAFPNVDNIGSCTFGTCRIWDLSLNISDTSILNRSGDGTTPNGAFTNLSACPAVIDGNETVTHSNSGEVFLRNASELLDLDDNMGDDDGLCETGEVCLYNPNFGAYQGHGNYKSHSCTFSNGAVTGVTMYAYPLNGE